MQKILTKAHIRSGQRKIKLLTNKNHAPSVTDVEVTEGGILIKKDTNE